MQISSNISNEEIKAYRKVFMNILKLDMRLKIFERISS